jgi:hypothetical protein
MTFMWKSSYKHTCIAVIFALSVLIFLIKGRSGGEYGDFLPVYGSVRCVLANSNPYKILTVTSQIISHGGQASLLKPSFWAIHSMLYPPLTYYLLSPLGLFPYPISGLIWFWVSAFVLIASFIVTAALSPPTSRVFVVLALSAVLATSSGLLRLGQLSGTVIGLTIIGSMLFLSNKRMALAGMLFFVAAALKPQLALPLLTYFLLSRSSRKYAFMALAGFLVASLLSTILLTHQLGSLQWLTDLRAEVHSATPAGPSARIDTGVIHLEALTSLISGRPVFYETVDYLIFAATALLILVGWLRAENHRVRDWVGVACISMLTLILVYHRSYDMRLQVLTFPALAILWKTSPKVASLLTLCSSFLIFSTAVVLLHWSTAHFGYQITHHLLFRIFIERQQAVFTLLAAVGWSITSAANAFDTSWIPDECAPLQEQGGI